MFTVFDAGNGSKREEGVPQLKKVDYKSKKRISIASLRVVAVC